MGAMELFEFKDFLSIVKVFCKPMANDTQNWEMVLASPYIKG
jgi:hypothetical protein